MSQTPYEILGISPDATREQITRAFRKLAVKYHPDKRTDDGKFLVIKEAYEALKAKVSSQSQPVFKASYKPFGGDLKVSINVPLRDVAEGKDKVITYRRKILCKSCKRILCGHCGGTGRDPVSLVMGPEKPCKICAGTGRIRSSDKCHNCGGTGIIEKTKSVQISLHPMLGGPIIFRGQGNEGEFGNGDLIVEIFIDKDKIYHISGLNLKRVLHISPAQAVLGGTVTIDVMGKKVNLTIPDGVQHGQILRKSGAGLYYSGRTGDLIVEVSIKIPLMISDKERHLYSQLLKLENF